MLWSYDPAPHHRPGAASIGRKNKSTALKDEIQGSDIKA